MSPETPGPVVIEAPVRGGVYGSAVASVEPGGAEVIPLADRHGRPRSLFWTWMSPNLEFATVYVGVLSVTVFRQTLWQAAAGIVLGTLLGSVALGILSARGPVHGAAQMILSRIPFGYRGNALPAGLNAVTAGVGWFAVNSVSGALALATLSGLPGWLSLVVVVVAQIAVAFLGHNAVHFFERTAFPLLGIAFVLAAVTLLPKVEPAAATGGSGVGGFLLTVGAAFGYAAGWTPFSSDYTRYLPPDSSRRAVALAAGGGVFVSCALLELLGAASATIAAPKGATVTAAFTAPMPGAVADLVLLAIVVGAISANAINVYSGTMSFLALGLDLPLALRRSIVALGFGGIGFLVALSTLDDPARYEHFLLVIAYWIGPWLGVFFTDQLLRRRHRVDGFLFDRDHRPWAGWVAMLVAMAVSIWLFANQSFYLGVVPRAHEAVGDVAFEVGFVLAALLYAGLFAAQRLDRERDEVLVLTD